MKYGIAFFFGLLVGCVLMVVNPDVPTGIPSLIGMLGFVFMAVFVEWVEKLVKK
jgi:xanthosine utilization system XapX-like protein